MKGVLWVLGHGGGVLDTVSVVTIMAKGNGTSVNATTEVLAAD